VSVPVGPLLLRDAGQLLQTDLLQRRGVADLSIGLVGALPVGIALVFCLRVVLVSFVGKGGIVFYFLLRLCRTRSELQFIYPISLDSLVGS
jgi:hypothetical protein